MKKIFFALAALVLAFTGCSQEEDAIQVSEKKAVKVVVNMDKPGFGEDTRAARTGWEEGDEVICTMGGPGIGIRLTYDADSDSWTTKILQVSDSDTDYVEVDFDEVMASFLENPEDAEGYIHAAYFSSGIYSLAFVEPPTIAMSITTNASSASPKMGECVMTCDNGTYEVEETADGYVLKLTITMVPQVAQFTIKNLLDGEDDEEGKTSEGLEVGVAGGNLITYAGGTITPAGIMLEPLVHLNGYNACWVHPNTDGINPVGISIYASVDAETNEFGADDTYTFFVGDDYYREFNCNTYKDDIYNGAAIIMDGPYTDGAASKWGEPE